ncbi:MAG: polyprenyl synthetase family protein, partial [Bacteroidales bacterium]|nr:polyprenyl synthetase family protein [Bacteroidales bacterium]
ILSRRTKNNPILIGEPGTGKTAIVEGLARRLVRGDVPDNLRDKQIYSLDMGALIAGAEEKVAQALYDFAFSLGIAFQIQDDLFDTFGQGTVFGKKIGGDIMNNKKTWLLVESFKVADNAQKDELTKIMAMTEEQGEEKIAKMQQMYITLGIKEAATEAIMGYYNKALDIIGKMDFTPAQMEQLLKFADKLVKRIK